MKLHEKIMKLRETHMAIIRLRDMVLLGVLCIAGMLLLLVNRWYTTLMSGVVTVFLIWYVIKRYKIYKSSKKLVARPEGK